MNNVFIFLFAVIGLVCVGCALFANDAQHQWVMAGICAAVILPLAAENYKEKSFKK